MLIWEDWKTNSLITFALRNIQYCRWCWGNYGAKPIQTILFNTSGKITWDLEKKTKWWSHKFSITHIHATNKLYKNTMIKFIKLKQANLDTFISYFIKLTSHSIDTTYIYLPVMANALKNHQIAIALFFQLMR